MRRANPILALLAMLAFGMPIQPSSFEPSASPELQIKWKTKTIQIALSTSLTLPSASITPESDVVAAVHRALNSWSKAANITFEVVSSKVQSISPASRGDGINLITIAPTSENLAIFAEGNNAARTRVFYDPATGEISEADIVINPYPYSAEDVPLQFSTDGTPGTYDLESTVAHEIGHLLGLSHSGVIAATMQASQGLNGTYGLPALTERTLSEADWTAIRSVYGRCEKSGSVEGKIQNSIDGKFLPVNAAHVWLEDLTAGRVIASSQTTSSGKFSIGCIPAGDYRVMVEYLDQQFLEPGALARDSRLSGRQRAFRSVEISGQLRVAPDKVASLNYDLVPPQNSAPTLNPRFLGLNSELSTSPLPAEAGTKLTLYVGGDGVDQVPGSGLSVSSPFITVDPASLTLQQFHDSTPVISFEVTLAANAPPGDYSIRLQSNSGEIAYLAGGITISPRF
ncbi:MAG: matrixin family metalloprotease [Acidobacteriota bacterium]|nr:matrixin family metalloprotease [Acidobacteriota bacterium]